MQITSRLLFAAFLQLFYVSVLARASAKVIEIFLLFLASQNFVFMAGKEEIAVV